MKRSYVNEPFLIPALSTTMRLLMIVGLLLILLACFGPVFESGISIREVPERLTTMFTDVLSSYP